MTFDSTGIIIGLAVFFVIFGIVSSVVYYFARYYFKIESNDKELLTEKPIEYGVEKGQPDKTHALAGTGTQVVAPSGETGTAATTATAKTTVQTALKNTRDSFWSKIKNTLTGRNELSPEDRDHLEEILFTNDLGPQTAELLLAKAVESARSGELQVERVREELKSEMLQIFSNAATKRQFPLYEQLKKGPRPCVWMIVGVNGAGKTTTIGKLASQAKTQGFKTLIVAGDTFRAAADEQLKVWADRAQVEYFTAPQTKDPSAVAYSALERAVSEKFDLVIVDTAGRLHTQGHLMEELKKMVRVMKKIIPDAPHEKIIVLDANSGQNALSQAKEFNAALDLTGTVVSKLDGSSKGGVTVGVAFESKLPICFIGIGEKVEDLRPFSAEEFVEALVQG